MHSKNHPGVFQEYVCLLHSAAVDTPSPQMQGRGYRVAEDWLHCLRSVGAQGSKTVGAVMETRCWQEACEDMFCHGGRNNPCFLYPNLKQTKSQTQESGRKRIKYHFYTAKAMGDCDLFPPWASLYFTSQIGRLTHKVIMNHGHGLVVKGICR